MQQQLYNDLLLVSNYYQGASRLAYKTIEKEWASGVFLDKCLRRILKDDVHIIHPDFSSIHNVFVSRRSLVWEPIIF